ncbi:QRFP-like peptide receptor [Clytia hemisphaerica]|uniref:G-protein coupled receptors family 1 profile domain-containing protein n=1 Tax=Clytia hemisphaerica TaxID=252671 RepID=A0A7M5X8T5_9CNID
MSRTKFLSCSIILVILAHHANTEKVFTESATTIKKDKEATTKMPLITKLITTMKTSSAAAVTEGNNFRDHTTEGFSFPQNINDLCKLFGISQKNCSCEIFLNDPNNNGIQDFIKQICEPKKVKPEKVLTYKPSLSRPYAIVAVVSASLGVLGNTAVIIVAIRREYNTMSNLLIAELATSDLLSAIIQLLMTIPLFWTNKWLFPGFMCKVMKSSRVLSGLLSVGFILMIACVRYQGLVTNPCCKTKKKKVHFFSIVNILMGICSIVPIILVQDMDPDLQKCWEYWPNGATDSLIYNIYLTVIYFVIPSIVVSVLYTKLAYKLSTAATNSYAFRGNQILFTRRDAENKKGAKLVIVIFVAFNICVLPNRIALIYLDAVDYKVSESAFVILTYLATIPFPLHVALNPIIYSIMDKKWRQEIWAVLTCDTKLIKGRRISSQSSTATAKSSISSTKSYNMNLRFSSVGKDDKGRNTSVDMGNPLVAYEKPVSLSFRDEVFLKQ